MSKTIDRAIAADARQPAQERIARYLAWHEAGVHLEHDFVLRNAAQVFGVSDTSAQHLEPVTRKSQV